MDLPPSRQTLFPVPPPSAAPPPASAQPPAQTHSRPASTPLRLFPPLAAVPAPAPASALASPGRSEDVSGESVRLAAEALGRMCLASPHRTPTASPAPSPRGVPNGGGNGIGNSTSTTSLEQAEAAVVRAMRSLSVRDTGPFLAFLDDIVSVKYAHVLQQYRNTRARRPLSQPPPHATAPLPRPLFQPQPQAPLSQQQQVPLQSRAGSSFVVFPRVPPAAVPATVPEAETVASAAVPATAVPANVPAHAQTPPAVLTPSARSAFTHAPTPNSARSSPVGTPRQALQISSLLS